MCASTELQAASAWLNTAMRVYGILWRVFSASRAFWIYQPAGSATADRAGNSPKRAAHQYTDWACNHSANGCTGSHTGHYAAPHQGGL